MQYSFKNMTVTAFSLDSELEVPVYTFLGGDFSGCSGVPVFSDFAVISDFSGVSDFACVSDFAAVSDLTALSDFCGVPPLTVGCCGVAPPLVGSVTSCWER